MAMTKRTRIEATAAPTSIPKNSIRRDIIHGAKHEAEETVRANRRPQRPNYDFYARVSAAELARSQGVHSIRRLGQIRAFSDPDPKQAEWFVREVRRWRREGLPRTVSR
jgi:hypothetical protein